jgi:hypothetical protein
MKKQNHAEFFEDVLQLLMNTHNLPMKLSQQAITTYTPDIQWAFLWRWTPAQTANRVLNKYKQNAEALDFDLKEDSVEV